MWQVGDWCFFEFKLTQVKEVGDGGRVTSVSDGAFTTGSYDLSDRLVPLSGRNNWISKEFESISKELHKNGVPGLNYPDIATHLVKLWLEAVDTSDNDDLREVYDRAYHFRDGILSATNVPAVQGVRVFR